MRAGASECVNVRARICTEKKSSERTSESVSETVVREPKMKSENLWRDVFGAARKIPFVHTASPGRGRFPRDRSPGGGRADFKRI